MGGLIVVIASLAWTVYADLRQRIAEPPDEMIAETVRVTFRETGQADASDRIVDVVVTEAIRAAADRETENWPDPDKSRGNRGNSKSERRR